MTGERIPIWEEGEYAYPEAFGFVPFIVSYMHEDRELRPGMLIVPGGGYRMVSPSEAHLPAMEFYGKGYNVFVLIYTANLLNCPLKLQPLRDISRAVRLLRFHADRLSLDPERIAVCGFSAGAHLCASLCVHYQDLNDSRPELGTFSCRPDAALLAYPVITSGKYAHKDSFAALFGANPEKADLEYMSLEKHVTGSTPPVFLWQTVTDATVPVENSCLFAEACRKAGVTYAHHVFSEGVHGMSVATEEWLERDFGDYYALEQIRMLTAAIRSGETPYPKEVAERIAMEFCLDGRKKVKWMEEEKEQIRGTLPEVHMWTELAEKWLSRRWQELSAADGKETEERK